MEKVMKEKRRKEARKRKRGREEERKRERNIRRKERQVRHCVQVYVWREERKQGREKENVAYIFYELDAKEMRKTSIDIARRRKRRSGEEGKRGGP
jgi:hypothetical protein